MSILLCTCHPQMKINRGIEMNQTLTAVWGNMDNIYFISKVTKLTFKPNGPAQCI